MSLSTRRQGGPFLTSATTPIPDELALCPSAACIAENGGRHLAHPNEPYRGPMTPPGFDALRDAIEDLEEFYNEGNKWPDRVIQKQGHEVYDAILDLAIERAALLPLKERLDALTTAVQRWKAAAEYPVSSAGYKGLCESEKALLALISDGAATVQDDTAT